MAEIAYVIDKLLSHQNHALVVCLVEAEKSNFSLDLKPQSKSYTKQALLNLCKEKDREIVPFLIKEELAYLKGQGSFKREDQLQFSMFRIAYSRSFQAIKLLAATGKLYFNHKQVAVDLFSKNPLTLHLDSAADGKIMLSATVFISGKDIAIHDCDFLCPGPPIWFIKGIFLKILSSDISWKNLKLLATEQLLFTQVQKEQFLEEVIDPTSPDSPQVVANPSLKATVSFEPSPILRLKDRLGAFADLWMDYGHGCIIPFHQPQELVKDSTGNLLCDRQLKVEKNWEKDLLETDFISKILESSHYYCPVDKVSKSLLFLLEIGWQILDFQGKQVLRMNQVVLDMQDKEETVKIKGKVHYDKFSADISSVVGTFNRKERFVSLGSEAVGLLPNKWEESVLQILSEDAELLQDCMQVKKSQFGSFADLWKQPDVTMDSSLKDLSKKLQNFKGLEHLPAGPNFLGSLRPYQQEGLNWLGFLYQFGFHGILADDMGLGKTVQVLAFLSSLPTSPFTLIILPSSLLFNWKKEIERFLPHFSFYLHHGSNRHKRGEELTKYDLILTSYATLRMDLALLSSLRYDCVILDEAQTIKNAHTQAAQAACQLNAKFRLSITGTPIENRWEELWSQFHFLMPDLLGDEEQFAAEIASSANHPRHLQKIKKKVFPFLLRRTKEEAAPDLPEKIEQTVWIPMGETQRQIYDDFLAGVKGNLLKKISIDGVAQHRIEILEAILRLRQICCHPQLVSNLMTDPQQEMDSAKLDALLTDMEMVVLEGKKALVYSQFTSMLHVIGKAAKDRGWKFVSLDGTTANREKVVQQFQEDPSLSLFLISLKAGGVGLNLTAADYVLLYEPWWNEAVEKQAIDRAHRIGRYDTVIAKRYVVTESIEERMMALKSGKRALVDGLLDETLTGILNEEDLYFLIG